MSRAQERPRCQRIFPQPFGAFRQLDLPRQVVRFELRDSLAAEQRILVATRRHEKFSGLVVLFDRLVRAILPLQQEGVAGYALGSLLCWNGTEKTVVDG
ncbi:MAG: hypothetical protein DMG39_04030 [Acidobacteria bacterium]|nr:MAG: hypothetical protein DMG39_04030 [Acidobacteriota bacterium]